jgi:hypothetical protein
MFKSFCLDFCFAGCADDLRGAPAADQAAALRPFCLNALGLKNHFEKFAFRNRPVHMEIESENGFGKRFDRIPFYKVRIFVGDNNVGRDQAAFECKAYSRLCHRLAKGAVPFHEHLYSDIFFKVSNRSPNIFRKPDFAL